MKKYETDGAVVVGKGKWDDNGNPTGIDIAPHTFMILVRVVVKNDALYVETYDGQKVTKIVEDDVDAWAVTDHNDKVIYVSPLGPQSGGDEFTLTPSNYRPPPTPKQGVINNPLNLEGWRKVSA